MLKNQFLDKTSKAVSDAWREADRIAREKALKEQMQNQLDAAEPKYYALLDVVYEAVRRHATDLGVLAYGNPDQYRIVDRSGVMRNSDHIRIADGRAYFAVAIRCRRFRRGEPNVALRDFLELFQAALDEVTAFWGYPEVVVCSVAQIVRDNRIYLGVTLT